MRPPPLIVKSESSRRVEHDAWPRIFKAWAERTAASLRSALGPANTAALPPARLAEHLDVVLWRCVDVPGITSDILQQLTANDPWGWSAVTVAVNGRVIVVYDQKSPGREASDIPHELAHVILNHDPTTVTLSESIDLSMRSFDQKQEDEADCLAWALLLPACSLRSANAAPPTRQHRPRIRRDRNSGSVSIADDGNRGAVAAPA